MKQKIRDWNAPSPWNTRIWDVKNNEWLCQSDKESVAYYGFDIRGGEVTILQGMQWVYDAICHDTELIWERSTSLQDKNGKEIYEGDIVMLADYSMEVEGVTVCPKTDVRWDDEYCGFILGLTNEGAKVLLCSRSDYIVVGNIHENADLLEGEK